MMIAFSQLLEREMARAARAPRLLVASDFDGTLAELADDPAGCRAVEGAVRSLVRLASFDETSVAIISGRSKKSLATVLGSAPGVRLMGSFGLEEDEGAAPVCGDEAESLDMASRSLARVCVAFTGTMLEYKPFGVAFHVRRVDPALRGSALAAARAVVGFIPGLIEAQGKDVLEFVVARAAKGRAIWRVIHEFSADTLVYFGDDHADEEVFVNAPQGSVTVKVGEGETAAALRLPDPGAAASWLCRLAALRESVLSS